jgi:flagellar hook-associated protein 3 FlgL
MMRITNAQITAMMHNSMNTNSAELGKLMQQMASAKRIMVPSDDPIASVRVLRVEREEASLEQYSKNIANVSGSLSVQEANLTSTSDAMLNVRDLLLWALNGSNSSADLASMASELEIIEGTIFSFANARDEEGRYLFSGTLSDTPALSYDTATQTYSVTGNDKHRQAAVANGVLVDENVTALAVYGNNVDLLNNLHELITRIKTPGVQVSDPALLQHLRDTLAELDASHGRVTGAITELGGRQNSLELLKNSNEEVSLVNQKITRELSELDYAGATIDLNNYQMALGATQKTYLKINEMSLFSLL